jgi:hypothetical protein
MSKPLVYVRGVFHPSEEDTTTTGGENQESANKLESAKRDMVKALRKAGVGKPIFVDSQADAEPMGHIHEVMEDASGKVTWRIAIDPNTVTGQKFIEDLKAGNRSMSVFGYAEDV